MLPLSSQPATSLEFSEIMFHSSLHLSTVSKGLVNVKLQQHRYQVDGAFQFN